MASVLASTKELLGIPSDVTDFDTQLLIHINSVLTTLAQLGIEADPPQLESGDELEDILTDEEIFSAVLIYIYTKVRLIFDPPTSSFVLDALQKSVQEQEWRLTDYVAS